MREVSKTEFHSFMLYQPKLSWLSVKTENLGKVLGFRRVFASFGWGSVRGASFGVGSGAIR